MIYWNIIDNKNFIENTDIEIKEFKNGNEMNDNQRLNLKIKPDYYIIWMVEFRERKFKTLPQITKYLKSETAIQTILNSVMDFEMDYMVLDKKLKLTTAKLSNVVLNKERLKSIENLTDRQKNKISKWIEKSK